MLTAAILGILGLIPGMPNLVFLLLASGRGLHGGGGWKAEAVGGGGGRSAAGGPAGEPGRELVRRDAGGRAGPEVGYRLIPMVDKGQDGELLKRIRGDPQEVRPDIGSRRAGAYPRQPELKPNDYRIVMKGVEIGTGSAFPGSSWRSTRAGWRARSLAARPPIRPSACPPVDRRQPAGAGPRPRLHGGGCQHRGGDAHQPPDPQPRLRALGRTETQAPARTHRQGDNPAGRGPGAEAAAPGHRAAVLQNLLDEGVNIRDMRSIVEVLAEHAPRVQDALELTSRGAPGPRPGHRPGALPGNGECR